MKRACILLLIIVSLLACKKEPELKTYVLEITKVEVETGTTTANIRATYSYPAELKSVYLKLSNNSDMSASENYLTTIDGNTLNVELNDLSVSTKYYYCFEYNNGVDQATTSVFNFITADYSLPIVNTKEVTNVTATSAECGGEVTDDGGATITARGVCWGTSHNPTINNSHTNDDQGLGEFISSITGLGTNVTYYVRAYATNSKGTSYGEECSFTTQEGLAAIYTNSVTNITATSAISGGNITDDGGFNITARGVCWSTMQNPTTTNNHTSDGSGLGEFSSSMTGLETNMTYYVRAYAINSKGTTYGQERSFTTQDGLAVITTNSVTNITAISAISGGNITDDGGFTITARGVCWDTNRNPTINNSHTNDATGMGEFISNIAGLDNNVNYYVRAYATNSKGTSYGEERSFTTQEGLATVTTNPVTEITATSAVSGGNISDDGGFSITARGVCWSTIQNPTINDSHTIEGIGTGSFISNIIGLTYNTTYYLRAYATNSMGTSYGEEKIFTTIKLAPTVTTNEVSSITPHSAICGGIVVSDGGSNVSVKGVCYSLSPLPTITDNHTSDGNGIGTFTSHLTGLIENTTYYVRAYATNNVGTTYGEQQIFTTTIPEPPTGAILGLFSVSETKRVWFSRGNLQYNAYTNTWKFAENQYDYCGTDNGNTGNLYNGWIDLYGWGTSGYNHGAICYQPWSTSSISNDYYVYGNSNYNLYDQNGQADWGYNTISNGGNTENIWRTLTSDEWNYVLFLRGTYTGIRFAFAVVNGVNGVVLLPDLWENSIYNLNTSWNFNSNIISEDVWSNIFEFNGAVFLPASGYRSYYGVSSIGTEGDYWSSTFYNNPVAYRMVFYGNDNGNDIYIANSEFRTRAYGLAVRLVCDY